MAGGMVSMDHIGMYDALESGLTRNDATLAAALATIGATYRRLVLSKAGDGIWTFASPWTIPANVILEIPPGVYVGGAGNGAINGILAAYTPGWYIGSGTITLPVTQAAYFTNLVTKSLGLNITPPLTQIHVSGDGVWPAVVRLEERAAGQTAAVQFYSNGVNRGQLGLPGTQHVTLNLANSANFVVSGGNLGLGMTPTQQLELSGSVAQKASGTTWANPSDERIKDVQRDFTDGLTLIQQFKTYWVKFNGLAGTPASLPEFVAPLAQEVQVYAPYMVGSYQAKLAPEDADTTAILNFDGSTLVYALCNAVQELDTMIAAQADLITAQQAALDALTARVDALEAP